MSLLVKQPGILSLLQDKGRIGAHNIGLTTGGALDQHAYYWANRLLNNDPNDCAIEVMLGGLVLEVQEDTYIALTGANMELTINDLVHEPWTSHPVKSGDIIELGMCTQGMRSYLAVLGGFTNTPILNSRSTVVRENIGGLNGQKLAANDQLPYQTTRKLECQSLAPQYRPQYKQSITLRVVPGYQHEAFSLLIRQTFFSCAYKMTDKADRMGVRLQGPDVASNLTQMLSEGITQGAIQIPADGQPIILLNDRQTIGGYPKIGSVIQTDINRLAQLRPGGEINFMPVDIHEAHNIHVLSHYQHKHNLHKCLHDH